MSNQMPFPFRCEYLPEFDSQHEAAVLIEEYKKSGHIKRCTYVRIRDIHSYMGAVTYVPHCEKDSFDVRKD